MRTWVDSEGLSQQPPCPFLGAMAHVRERRRPLEACPEVADRAHRTVWSIMFLSQALAGSVAFERARHVSANPICFAYGR